MVPKDLGTKTPSQFAAQHHDGRRLSARQTQEANPWVDSGCHVECSQFVHKFLQCYLDRICTHTALCPVCDGKKLIEYKAPVIPDSDLPISCRSLHDNVVRQQTVGTVSRDNFSARALCKQELTNTVCPAAADAATATASGHPYSLDLSTNVNGNSLEAWKVRCGGDKCHVFSHSGLRHLEGCEEGRENVEDHLGRVNHSEKNIHYRCPDRLSNYWSEGLHAPDSEQCYAEIAERGASGDGIALQRCLSRKSTNDPCAENFRSLLQNGNRKGDLVDYSLRTDGVLSSADFIELFDHDLGMQMRCYWQAQAAENGKRKPMVPISEMQHPRVFFQQGVVFDDPVSSHDSPLHNRIALGDFPSIDPQNFRYCYASDATCGTVASQRMLYHSGYCPPAGFSACFSASTRMRVENDEGWAEWKTMKELRIVGWWQFLHTRRSAVQGECYTQARPARFLSFGIQSQNPKIMNSTDMVHHRRNVCV